MILIDSSVNPALFNIDTEMDIILSDEPQTINTTNFKDNLLASLYTQLEFLKNQMVEKDDVIKSLIKLNSDCEQRDEFLRNQIVQKDAIIQSLVKQKSNARVFSYYEDISDETDSDSDSDGILSAKSLNYSVNESSKTELSREISDSRGNGSTASINAEDDVNAQFQDEMKTKLDKQLSDVRYNKHQNYMREFNPAKEVDKSVNKRNILVASDSMMNQIDGNRLSKTFDVKVMSWGGCSINELMGKLEPILEKQSFEYIIIHVGTNDSTTRTSDDMLHDIILLKDYIELTYSSKVIISNIIERQDDMKANLTIQYFNEKLSKLNLLVMDNSNIISKYLGKKGHHLTSPHGSGRLAMNIINLIRRL